MRFFVVYASYGPTVIFEEHDVQASTFPLTHEVKKRLLVSGFSSLWAWTSLFHFS
jgi:hypothetical protein